MLPYAAAIQAKVRDTWTRPDSVPLGQKCQVTITQIPGGQVLQAKVGANCPYDEAGKRSIEAAVLNAQPLPIDRAGQGGRPVAAGPGHHQGGRDVNDASLACRVCGPVAAFRCRRAAEGAGYRHHRRQCLRAADHHRADALPGCGGCAADRRRRRGPRRPRALRPVPHAAGSADRRKAGPRR
ncbi:hypothetical protein G6F57_016592 [Rhizopus arrhizus]|nr:hypothetical protein G6F57_016592 [Rhizopus arrhizus]